MCSGVGIQALQKFNIPYGKIIISVTFLITIVFAPDFMGKYLKKLYINVNSGHEHRIGPNSPVSLFGILQKQMRHSTLSFLFPSHYPCRVSWSFQIPNTVLRILVGFNHALQKVTWNRKWGTELSNVPTSQSQAWT